MKQLNIDIETYSDMDLPKVGVYKYVDSPNFEVLLFSYAADGGEVQTVDLASGETMPDDIMSALTDPKVTKVAFNAQFERVALSTWFEGWLDPAQWHCTMVWANELGLPAGLGQVAKYLGIDQQKDTRGTQLINFFSKPCKPTKANGQRSRNMPADDPEKWATFSYYNAQDVRTEMAIAKALAPFPVKPSEWQLYALDQHINDRGVGVDTKLAAEAVSMMEHQNDSNVAQLKALTGLDNPNSLKQFKEWLADNGHPFDKLGKALVQKALTEDNLPSEVAQALRLRLSLSNSSTKKFTMMKNAECDDGRVHGLLQFYGANRTGRWAGRLVQVQNLPRNNISTLDTARDLVKDGNSEGVELIYGSVPDTLKQLVRTALTPANGNLFYICDFSAIEARVIAWLAGEEWSLETFRTHGKIYEATASKMFGIPIEQIDHHSPYRQRGKVATLALGYQGGANALVTMGALENGITEDELPDLVQSWRKANPHVVRFWYDVQNAATDVLQNGGVAHLQKGMKLFKKQGFMFIQLASGRRLAYANARLQEGKYGPEIVYDGQGDRVGYATLHTYGGKLVENIVQATARDLLAEAMWRLDRKGFSAVFHVHDEVVVDAPVNLEDELKQMENIMCEVPEWAKGLPLNAAGYTTPYYRKD